ncbi:MULTISPECIES: hypothetical protein [unclassified Micromonospora]|uniref:hypothetical protein n=1 Tax=unclassified Micromonospora TaxID=2617518 RepID=UPI003333F772
MEDGSGNEGVLEALRVARPGGTRRLAHLISRYGRAIERDLQRIYHLDLGTEWRARRWRKLLNLIDGLPRDSAFVEALTSDEQWARSVLDNPPPENQPARRMSEWSPQLEMLTNLYDAVRENTRAVIASAGGKPGKVLPAPRPVTALERARRARRWEKHRSVVARVLPHRAEHNPA